MKLPFKLPAGMVFKGSKLLMKLKDISPELCLAGSIITGIGCVVTACMSTVKSEPEVNEAKKKIDEIKQRVADIDKKYGDEPTEGENDGGKKDEKSNALVSLSKEDKAEIVKIKVDTGVKVLKNYILPASLGLLSIVLNIGGNRILRKNLAGAVAAYGALLESYNEYRRRVIEDGGTEKDQEYMHGIKTQVIETVDENGNVVTKVVNEGTGKHPISRYARWFDQGAWDSENKCWIHRNLAWKDDPDRNLRFLMAQEKYANQLLQMNGIVFLNEVYKMLGLPMTFEGQLVGWTLEGSKYISFGVFDGDRQLPCNRQFINGNTPNVLLDFNVEGNIAKKLRKSFGDEYAEKLLVGGM